MGVSQQQIADRLNLARSTVTKILNQFPNNRASRETVRKVFQTAREMGYDFARLRNIHRRRADRKAVSIPVNLRIDLVQGGVFDTGTAVIKNLSPYGAFITGFKTRKQILPLLAFDMVLQLGSPLEGVELITRLVRLSITDRVEMGVDFIEFVHDAEQRIIEFLS